MTLLAKLNLSPGAAAVWKWAAAKGERDMNRGRRSQAEKIRVDTNALLLGTCMHSSSLPPRIKRTERQPLKINHSDKNYGYLMFDLATLATM
jgi:hypothetical protein